MAHHIISAEAAWVTESTAQIQITFEDGEVVPVTVMLPPPPGPASQQFWPDELLDPDALWAAQNEPE
jgi:hypothetical protein